jgi:hypothetical protein
MPEHLESFLTLIALSPLLFCVPQVRLVGVTQHLHHVYADRSPLQRIPAFCTSLTLVRRVTCCNTPPLLHCVQVQQAWVTPPCTMCTQTRQAQGS